MTEAKFDKCAIRLANKAVQRAKEGAKRPRQHDVHMATLRMIAFADSCFAHNDDFGTQLVYSIIFINDTRRANLLSYTS